MSTTFLDSHPRPSALPRRTFRWDSRIDQPAAQASDTRMWLASRSEGGRIDPETPDPETWSAGLARAIVEAVRSPGGPSRSRPAPSSRPSSSADPPGPTPSPSASKHFEGGG